MEKRNLRVMVASEYPQARDYLKGIVQKEEDTFFVGQAPDGTRAITLARNLKPDVAIIDSNLPHSVGLDAVRLSRMGGLDTAQTIYDTLPNTCVIVITNLNIKTLAEHSPGLNNGHSLVRERIGETTAFKLKDLCQEALLPGSPVFASVDTEPLGVLEKSEMTEKAIFLGASSTAAGLFLIATLWLSPFGILLVLAGISALTFGLAKKIFARFRRSSQIQTES